MPKNIGCVLPQQNKLLPVYLELDNVRKREFRRKSAINHQLEKGHLNFHCRNIKSGFDKEKLIMKRCIKGVF